MTVFQNFSLMFSKKKQQQQQQEDSLKYGYQIENKIIIGQNNIFLNLFVRSIIVYLCIIGSIDAYMSAFNLPYDMAKIMINLGLVTLGLILIQYNTITRMLGYCGLIYILTQYMDEKMPIIRSGIVAILNMSYELIRVKFALPSVDGFTEAIADRSVTVTTAIIVIGCFFIIVFWEVAGRSMNLIITAVLTFTALSAGLYFDGVPSIFSILSFGTIWLFVGIVKFHSKTEISSGRVPYKNVFRKNKRYYHKHSDGKTLLQLLILSFVFTLLSTSLIKPIFNEAVFEKTVMPSELKQSSDKMLKNIMIVGFSRYKGFKVNGKISDGQLGNYSSLNPDYRPDLEIEFLPVSMDNIYLKSFIGSVYNSDGWYQTAAEPYTDQSAMTMTATAFSQSDYPISRMRIKNVGVITNRPLLPYYTNLDSVNLPTTYISDDILNGRFNIGEISEFIYYPYTNSQAQSTIECDDITNGYRDYVYNNYLQVPKKNSELIESLCKEKGWSIDDENVTDKIAQYFQDEFTYTLNPGLVPWKTDFVNYFLFENKEGVCAHYASAGTLILRTLGIPARYVEGYALPFSSIYEGEAIEYTDLSYWYEGNTATLRFKPTKVVLSDINAHAWVEIYKDGFGWVPVEFTPAANIDEENKEKSNEEQWADFFTKLMNSLSSDGNSPTLIPEETITQISENLSSISYDLSIIILCVLLFAVYFKHIKRCIVLCLPNRQNALISTYSHLVKILAFLKIVNENPSFKEVASHFENSEDVILIEKALYSENGLERSELNTLIKKVGLMKRAVIKKQSILKQLVIFIKV